MHRHLEILFEGDLPSLGINVEVYLFAITKITLFFRIDNVLFSVLSSNCFLETYRGTFVVPFFYVL